MTVIVSILITGTYLPSLMPSHTSPNTTQSNKTNRPRPPHPSRLLAQLRQRRRHNRPVHRRSSRRLPRRHRRLALVIHRPRTYHHPRHHPHCPPSPSSHFPSRLITTHTIQAPLPERPPALETSPCRFHRCNPPRFNDRLASRSSESGRSEVPVESSYCDRAGCGGYCAGSVVRSF